MSILPEEYHNSKQFKLNERAKRVLDLKQIQSNADKVSQLVADPRWEFYGRYLETRREGADKLIAQMENSLRSYFMEGKEYGETKVKLAYNKGVSDALSFAMEIARTTIEQGEKAAAELTNLQQGEK